MDRHLPSPWITRRLDFSTWSETDSYPIVPTLQDGAQNTTLLTMWIFCLHWIRFCALWKWLIFRTQIIHLMGTRTMCGHTTTALSPLSIILTADRSLFKALMKISRQTCQVNSVLFVADSRYFAWWTLENSYYWHIFWSLLWICTVVLHLFRYL